MNTKTVVVTGGLGYIGSHIVKRLKQNNYRVVVIDWKSDSYTSKYADKVVHADIASPAAESVLLEEKPAAVVHCAGYISVGESVTNPSIYYNNNVVKTLQLLEFLRKSSDQKPAFIFSSSAAVYGNPRLVPITETAPTLPINPYGRSKLMVEQALSDYFCAYQLNSVSLRYFNACGADPDGELGQESGAGHLIARLLESYQKKQQFILNGNTFDTEDGTCVRDYVHVVDLAEAHIKAIEYLEQVPGAHQFNLGTGKGVSNAAIVRSVQQLVGSPEIQIGPKRAGDPDELVADSRLAKQQLGWTAEYSGIDTIIRSAWNWYNQ